MASGRLKSAKAYFYKKRYRKHSPAGRAGHIHDDAAYRVFAQKGFLQLDMPDRHSVGMGLQIGPQDAGPKSRYALVA